jgi:hypothetical protein
VYYGRGSAKVLSSKTLPRCDESPVHRIFVKTGDNPATMTWLFEFCSKPPTLSCTTTFRAGSGCTTEEAPPKLYRPRPFLVVMSRPLLQELQKRLNLDQLQMGHSPGCTSDHQVGTRTESNSSSPQNYERTVCRSSKVYGPFLRP